MTIILCAINSETGEVLNLDGSVAGKVVPQEATEQMMQDGWRSFENYLDGRAPSVRTSADAADICYDAMLAASRVDLSGCEVKVPPKWKSGALCAYGVNRIIQSILAQMPKVKK